MPKTKVSKKFSITIPKDIRRTLNIKPGDILVFMKESNKAYFINSGSPKPKDTTEEKSAEYASKLREHWSIQEKKLGLEKPSFLDRKT
jgi:AbrB family looped-hinge helix DNA binding protein